MTDTRPTRYAWLPVVDTSSNEFEVAQTAGAAVNADCDTGNVHICSFGDSGGGNILYEEGVASLLIQQPEHDTVKEESDQTFVLAIRTFGAQQSLAQRLVEHIALWERVGRPFRWNPQGLTHGLQIRIYPADTAYTPTSNEFVVDRPGSRMVFQW